MIKEAAEAAPVVDLAAAEAAEAVLEAVLVVPVVAEVVPEAVLVVEVVPEVVLVVVPVVVLEEVEVALEVVLEAEPRLSSNHTDMLVFLLLEVRRICWLPETWLQVNPFTVRSV